MLKIALLLLLSFVSICGVGQTPVNNIRFDTCINDARLPQNFYHKKFLVLDFWASWCAPCINSFPKVRQLEKNYRKNRNIVFATIAPEPGNVVAAFFGKKENRLPGTLYLADLTGSTVKKFGIERLPAILVFSPEGNIVFQGDIEQLLLDMDKILKENFRMP